MLYWLFLDYSDKIAKIDFWLVVNRIQGKLSIDKGRNIPVFTKNSSAVFILPADSVLLTELNWSKKIPLEKRTIIYALEEKIIEDLDNIEIEVLEQQKDKIKIGVFNKKLLQNVHNLAKQAKLFNYQITTQTLLPPFSNNHWSLWKTEKGLIFRYDKYLGTCLPFGFEKIGIDIKLAEAIKINQAPQALDLCDYDSFQEYYDKINYPLPTVKAKNSIIEKLDFKNLVIFRKNQFGIRDFLFQSHRALSGIYQPVLIIILIVIIAFLGNLIKVSHEVSKLQKQIDDNFYQIFPKNAVKTVNPLAQIENKYLSIVKNNESNFISAFSILTDKLTKSQENSKPKKIFWQNEILTVEFENLPNINNSIVNNMIINVEGNKVKIYKNQL